MRKDVRTLECLARSVSSRVAIALTAIRISILSTTQEVVYVEYTLTNSYNFYILFRIEIENNVI